MDCGIIWFLERRDCWKEGWLVKQRIEKDENTSTLQGKEGVAKVFTLMFVDPDE